jgi:hypothetical protein
LVEAGSCEVEVEYVDEVEDEVQAALLSLVRGSLFFGSDELLSLYLGCEAGEALHLDPKTELTMGFSAVLSVTHANRSHEGSEKTPVILSPSSCPIRSHCVSQPRR